MDVLTTPQAAKLLGVHRNSAKRTMIARGLEPVRIGKSLAWNRADVERLAEQAPLTNVPPPGSNRKFVKAATFNVATNPPTPAEVKRRLAARNRRRTGADGVFERAYAAMLEHVAEAGISTATAEFVMLRAALRHEG